MKAWGIALVFCYSVFLTGCATQRAPLMWDAERATDYGTPYIRLNDREGKTHGTVSREQLRQIMDVTRRIEVVAGTTVKVTVASGDEPNAFAWRHEGVNRIGFTLGMLNLLGSDYDAYAAIIGHEVAHLVLEHGAVRKEREGVRSVASQLLGIALGAAGVPMSGTVANVATTAVSTVFTRDEERDADKHGIDFARRAGFDPYGAVRAWEKMSQRSSGFSIPFLSTHPMAQERLETMRQIAATSPRVDPAPQPTAPKTTPTPARVAVARLRPIGSLRDAPNPLMAGDLYVDMGSISSVPDSANKRAWWIINSNTASQSDGSMKARLIVNCESASIAVLHTFRTSAMNGEGKAIDAQDHVRLIEPKSPVLEDAVRAMCE